VERLISAEDVIARRLKGVLANRQNGRGDAILEAGVTRRLWKHYQPRNASIAVERGGPVTPSAVADFMPDKLVRILPQFFVEELSDNRITSSARPRKSSG
jgi:hypothetical protein